MDTTHDVMRAGLRTFHDRKEACSDALTAWPAQTVRSIALEALIAPGFRSLPSVKTWLPGMMTLAWWLWCGRARSSVQVDQDEILEPYHHQPSAAAVTWPHGRRL